MTDETAPETPMMVPSHGRGLLKRGGKHPNSGRPASAIRRRLRGGLAQRIPDLEKIADEAERDSDRLKALDLMAKYGMGTEKHITTDDVRERLAGQLEDIRAELDPETAERLIARIEKRWR